MSNKLSYSSIGKSVDGTTFCSGVETLADNLIEDNEADAAITVPSKTGWLALRSEDYRVTDVNACIVLPYDIYKIKKVYLRAGSLLSFSAYVGNDASKGPAWYKGDTAEGFYPFNNSIPASKCYLSNTGKLWDGCIDITHLVKTKEEYKSLNLVDASVSNNSINKNNTLYYSQGSNKIMIGEAATRLFSSPRACLISLILKYIHDFNALALETKNTDFERKLYTYVKDHKVVEEGEGTKIYSSDGTYIVSNSESWFNDDDIRDWQFRIEYVPMSSKTKIRARKNAPTKVEYIQPFNQRAEINAASAFGKNMWLTAQKTGVREIKFIKNYPNIKKIPPLGALIRCGGKKYRLVAKHHSMTNHQYIQVTHMLSENWSEKSKHVAVDQKYRNWSIPQETLWRNLYWEDYLRVGTSLKTSDNVTSGVFLADIMQGLYRSSENDKTVDVFSWTTDEDIGKLSNVSVTGAVLPCSTYGIASSLIFSASFKDNLSAGLRATKWEEGGEHLCEEAMYCKADGTLDIATVTLGEGIRNYNSTHYPSIYGSMNVVETVVFEKEFYIYKDPGEALKFTYQIHLIGEDDCFFGNKFAEHNPLIKDWKGANRKFKVWALTHYAREGSDILETLSSDTAYEHTSDGAYFTIAELAQNAFELKKYGEVFTLTLSDTMAAALQGVGCKAWAITDENNNLYVACNDASVKTLYFQLHHKR